MNPYYRELMIKNRKEELRHLKFRPQHYQDVKRYKSAKRSIRNLIKIRREGKFWLYRVTEFLGQCYSLIKYRKFLPKETVVDDYWYFKGLIEEYQFAWDVIQSINERLKEDEYKKDDELCKILFEAIYGW